MSDRDDARAPLVDLTVESYFHIALTQPDRIVEEANTHLTVAKFDTLVGTGLSGALVVPLLARAFDTYFMIVRKGTESSHSRTRGEGRLGQSWIFVDDLVCTGDTRRHVRNTIATITSSAGVRSRYLGTYTYTDGGHFTWGSDEDD